MSKLHNNFRIIAKDIFTGEEVIGFAENIVLQSRVDTTAVTGAMYNGPEYIGIGTGTTPPSPMDTDLENRVLFKKAQALINNGSNAYWDTSEYKVGGTGIMKYQGFMRVEASEIVGSVITEIGLGPWSGGVNAITRALIQDANGNPLAITKTNTMVLDIYCTAFITIPETVSGYKITGSLPMTLSMYKINPLDYGNQVCLRSGRYGKSWKEEFVPSMGPDSGFEKNASEVIDSPNKKRIYTISSISAGECNIGGIRSIHLQSRSGKGIEIPVPNDNIIQPVIVKEVVGTGDGLRKDFPTKFGWIRNNGTCKVYINDIEQSSGVTVLYDSPSSINGAAFYMKQVGTWVPNPNNLPKDVPIFENTLGRGIVKVKLGSTNYNALQTSDNIDGPYVTAVSIGGSTSWLDIPEAHKNKQFWSSDGASLFTKSVAIQLSGDIIFDNPPSVGDVVSVSYQPDCIAKDETKIINNLTYALGF